MMPNYEYRGSGLLDDDPRGLRKRNKSVAVRVLSNGCKLLILVLLALCAGGWLYTHRHKKALLENVSSLVTSLNESHEQHGELVRSLMTHQEETRTRDAEIQGLRNRLERLSKELTNTHGHHSEQNNKLQEDMLAAVGELQTARSRVQELEEQYKQYYRQSMRCQAQQEVEVHLRLKEERQKQEEIAGLRRSLSQCTQHLSADLITAQNLFDSHEHERLAAMVRTLDAEHATWERQHMDQMEASLRQDDAQPGHHHADPHHRQPQHWEDEAQHHQQWQDQQHHDANPHTHREQPRHRLSALEEHLGHGHEGGIEQHPEHHAPAHAYHHSPEHHAPAHAYHSPEHHVPAHAYHSPEPPVHHGDAHWQEQHAHDAAAHHDARWQEQHAHDAPVHHDAHWEEQHAHDAAAHHDAHWEEQQQHQQHHV